MVGGAHAHERTQKGRMADEAPMGLTDIVIQK